jgi:hypothetical protein
MFTPAAAYRMVVMVMMPPAPMMVIVGIGRCYRTQHAGCKRECKQNLFHKTLSVKVFFNVALSYGKIAPARYFNCLDL